MSTFVVKFEIDNLIILDCSSGLQQIFGLFFLHLLDPKNCTSTDIFTLILISYLTLSGGRYLKRVTSRT